MFVLRFQFAELFGFERCAGVALHAADAPALRKVAGEAFAQQVGGYDFVVDFDHLRQVSAMMMSYNSPSVMPMHRTCLGTMLPALMPGMELISIR